MTFTDLRRDRQTFMRHFGKVPETIRMHPLDFMEVANEATAIAVYAKPDGVISVLGMTLIEDPKMPIGEIELQ